MENPTTLEQEVTEIERRLAEKRVELEQKKQSGEIKELPHEKETLHKVVGEKIQEKIPKFQPKAPPPAQSTDEVQVPPSPHISEPPPYLSLELKDKVQELVDITFQENLDKAIKQVQDIGNSALIDAFHSVLVDELYQQLIERGKIKKL